MDDGDVAYEDRGHGHSPRKHRPHHRQERRGQEGGDLGDCPDGGSPRSRDGKRRDGEWQRFSGRDSLDVVERRHGRSKSPDRGDLDSAERDSVEKHSDKDRRRRSARDSPPARRERSRSSERGEGDSVERNQIAREESVERRPSKKRKEDGGSYEDTTQKRTRLLDETKEEEREVDKERRRFGDGANEDTGSLNGDHEEKRRRDGKQPKEHIEEVGDSGEGRKERNFEDGVIGQQLGYGEDGREERGPSGVIKEEKMSGGEEGRVSGREERRGKEIPEGHKSMDELEEGISKDRVKEEFGYREETKPQVSATGIEKCASEQKDLEKEASQNTHYKGKTFEDDVASCSTGVNQPNWQMLCEKWNVRVREAPTISPHQLQQQLQEQKTQMEEMCAERCRDRREIEDMRNQMARIRPLVLHYVRQTSEAPTPPHQLQQQLQEQMEEMCAERRRNRQEIDYTRDKLARMRALMYQYIGQTSRAPTSPHQLQLQLQEQSKQMEEMRAERRGDRQEIENMSEQMARMRHLVCVYVGPTLSVPTSPCEGTDESEFSL